MLAAAIAFCSHRFDRFSADTSNFQLHETKTLGVNNPMDRFYSQTRPAAAVLLCVWFVWQLELQLQQQQQQPGHVTSLPGCRGRDEGQTRRNAQQHVPTTATLDQTFPSIAGVCPPLVTCGCLLVSLYEITRVNWSYSKRCPLYIQSMAVSQFRDTTIAILQRLHLKIDFVTRLSCFEGSFKWSRQSCSSFPGCCLFWTSKYSSSSSLLPGSCRFSKSSLYLLSGCCVFLVTHSVWEGNPSGQNKRLY